MALTSHPHLLVRLKKEWYLYSPYGLSWPFLGLTLRGSWGKLL
jgi:hypothetical protein